MSSPQITRMLGLSIGVLGRAAEVGKPRFTAFASAGFFVFAIAGFSSLFFKGAIMREVGLFRPRNLAARTARVLIYGRKRRGDDRALRLPHNPYPSRLAGGRFVIETAAPCARSGLLE